jgi:hypothetical protein
MTVKELIDVLSSLDQESIVMISVESNRSLSGSDDVSIMVTDDEYVTICGEETFYQ